MRGHSYLSLHSYLFSILYQLSDSIRQKLKKKDWNGKAKCFHFYILKIVHDESYSMKILVTLINIFVYLKIKEQYNDSLKVKWNINKIIVI